MTETSHQTIPRSVHEAVVCGLCKSWLNDPHILRCSHNFCLTCVEGLLGKKCPSCQEMVEPETEISKLPYDTLTAQLVSLAQQHCQLTDSNRTLSPCFADERSIPKPIRIYLIPPVKEVINLSDKSKEKEASVAEDSHSGPSTVSSRSKKQRLDTDEIGELISNFASILGHMGESSDTFTVLFTAHVGDLLNTCREQAKQMSKSDPSIHSRVTCDKCGKSAFSSYRYKCGMCTDYDLCHECFPDYEKFHDKTHLFIVLKRRAIKINRHGRSVNMHLSAMYAQCVERQCKTHARILCESCRMSPIIGHRMKCGICEDCDFCEECFKKSDEIHDTNHTFVIIPNEVGVQLKTPLQTKFFF